MKILRYSLVTFMSFVALTVVGQNSGGAVQFPELTPDVRGVGMGNTGVASSANAFSLWRNAAKSVFADSKMEVGYSFTPWLRELMSGSDMHVVGGDYNIDNKQGIMAGFRWFKHTEIELGEKVFTPKDWSVDVGYTRKLTQELSLGVVARFVRSNMSMMDEDAIANAVAFDLGVYYQRKLSWSANSYWAIGLQASNFGTKIDYGYGKYDQPAKVSVGGMICHVFGEKHCLQGSLDIGNRVLPDSRWDGALGVEYRALNIISVRGGYHYGEENNRMQRYGTLGCGVTLFHVQVDVAYIIPETDSFLKNTWQVALSVNL